MTMRKAYDAVCVYDKDTNQIVSLVLHTRTSYVPLIDYTEDKELAYKHATFNSMYLQVLRTINNNGYFLASQLIAGAEFYDILFIDCHNLRPLRYGYKEVIK